MDSNKFANTLQGIMLHAQTFIAQVKTGEGITFDTDPAKNEEKKKEFLKQMSDTGGFEQVKELESKMNEFKEKLKQQANYGPANKTN